MKTYSKKDLGEMSSKDMKRQFSKEEIEAINSFMKNA